MNKYQKAINKYTKAERGLCVKAGINISYRKARATLRKEAKEFKLDNREILKIKTSVNKVAKEQF